MVRFPYIESKKDLSRPVLASILEQMFGLVKGCENCDRSKAGKKVVKWLWGGLPDSPTTCERTRHT
jgi:hypothetical protein